MKIPIIPFTGAIAEAAGTVYEKTILRKKKVDCKVYNVFSFLVISILTLVLILILGKFIPSLFSFRITPEALSLRNISLMLLVIVFSIAANLFTFFAMKWEKLTEIEPIRLTQPLFTIVLAFIFFASERQAGINIILASFIAAIALIFSHLKKHHIQLNKYSSSALLGSFFFALELIISRFILDLYSPITFYLIRCLGIFLISYIIFKPDPRSMRKDVWKATILTGFIWVLYRIILYFSFTHSGVIMTTLTLSLVTPVFIYVLSKIYLKEKLTWRNIVASIIIVLCVAYAMLMSGS